MIKKLPWTPFRFAYFLTYESTNERQCYGVGKVFATFPPEVLRVVDLKPDAYSKTIMPQVSKNFLGWLFVDGWSPSKKCLRIESVETQGVYAVYEIVEACGRYYDIKVTPEMCEDIKKSRAVDCISYDDIVRCIAEHI